MRRSMRRAMETWAAWWAAAVLMAAAAPGLADGPDNPADIVSETARTLVERLNAEQDSLADNPDITRRLVREELLPIMDLEYSARLILGRAGRGATPEQVRDFGEALSGQLIDRYASGLAEYRSRDQLDILPTRGELNERMTRVRTRVQLGDGRFIPVDYVFRKTDDGWKAFDVIVEGISYVTTFRNQIMPQVQASGIEAVTERLQQGRLKLEE